MKVSIEQRTVTIPANKLPAGVFFRYKDVSQYREEPCNQSFGILLKVNIPDKAVNLYSGEIVPVLNMPYDVIRDVEFRGWV